MLFKTDATLCPHVFIDKIQEWNFFSCQGSLQDLLQIPSVLKTFMGLIFLQAKMTHQKFEIDFFEFRVE